MGNKSLLMMAFIGTVFTLLAFHVGAVIGLQVTRWDTLDPKYLSMLFELWATSPISLATSSLVAFTGAFFLGIATEFRFHLHGKAKLAPRGSVIRFFELMFALSCSISLLSMVYAAVVYFSQNPLFFV